MIEKRKRGRNICAAALWLEGDHLANDSQDMAAALARRQKQLHPVAEQEQPHLVAAARGRTGQRGADFGGELALAAPHRAECAGSRNVHRQDDAQFTFLAKAFHEGASHAESDVPVDVAHVVAGDVIAQFLEIHAAPFEMAEVGADHHVVDQAVGANFHPAHGFEDFVERHAGMLVGDEVTSLGSLSPKMRLVTSSPTVVPALRFTVPGWY